MKTIYISLSVVVMFITGIIQWDLFPVSWEYYNMVQALHIIGSITIFVMLIIPFVNMHTYKYRRNIIGRKKNSINGIFLGITLLLITISGFYLFLIGNRGGDIWGIYSFYIQSCYTHPLSLILAAPNLEFEILPIFEQNNLIQKIYP